MDTWEPVRCGQRLTADAPQERSRRARRTRRGQ